MGLTSKLVDSNLGSGWLSTGFPDVPRVDTIDSVIGADENNQLGISNEQATALANRTRNLNTRANLLEYIPTVLQADPSSYKVVYIQLDPQIRGSGFTAGQVIYLNSKNPDPPAPLTSDQSLSVIAITIGSVDSNGAINDDFIYDSDHIYGPPSDTSYDCDPAGGDLPALQRTGTDGNYTYTPYTNAALFHVQTRYAPGDTPVIGRLQYLPYANQLQIWDEDFNNLATDFDESDPLVQSSRMIAYVDEQINNTTFQKFKGFYSSLDTDGTHAPTMSDVSLKVGYLYHYNAQIDTTSSSTGKPTTGVATWPNMMIWTGSTWVATDPYTPDQHELWDWYEYNPASFPHYGDQTGWYFFGTDWRSLSFNIDVTQFGFLAGGVSASTPQVWSGYNQYSNPPIVPSNTTAYTQGTTVTPTPSATTPATLAVVYNTAQNHAKKVHTDSSGATYGNATGSLFGHTKFSTDVPKTIGASGDSTTLGSGSSGTLTTGIAAAADHTHPPVRGYLSLQLSNMATSSFSYIESGSQAEVLGTVVNVTYSTTPSGLTSGTTYYYYVTTTGTVTVESTTPVWLGARNGWYNSTSPTKRAVAKFTYA